MQNPDPSKFVVRKLKRRGLVLMDRETWEAVKRWRKRRRKEAKKAIELKSEVLCVTVTPLPKVDVKKLFE